MLSYVTLFPGNYVLTYLAGRPKLTSFVSQSLVQVGTLVENLYPLESAFSPQRIRHKKILGTKLCARKVGGRGAGKGCAI